MKRHLILAASLLTFSSTGFGAQPQQELVIPITSAHDAVDLDDLKEVRITSSEALPEIANRNWNMFAQGEGLPVPNSGWSGVASQGLGALIGVGEGLLTFGQKAWELIKASKGVSNLQYGNPITVIPQTQSADPAAAFNSMENWQDPKMKTFTVEFKNWRNAVAVSFNYIVSFQYGGQFEGKGAYLQGVAISAGANSVVGPLWSVDANAQYLGSSNSGSRESPIAGLRLIVSYTVERNALGREYKGSHVIFVKGDGKIAKLEEAQDPVGPEAK